MHCLVTAEQLAKELDLQPDTIRLAAKAGVIPCYPFTKRTIRFDLNECRAILQTKLKEYELAISQGPPKKNEAEVVASAQDYGAQKEVYNIGSGKSRRKFPHLINWLFAELVAALSDARPRDLEERQIIRSLRKSTINKLRAVTT